MKREFELKSARFIAADCLRRFLLPGDTAVDATMGNGHDTLMLCELVGENGRVYAFDVQEQAVENTKKRLEDAGVLSRAELYLRGHQNMKACVPSPVQAVMFNLGWLPGAEHGVTTQTSTTLLAVEAAVSLLKEEAIMTICIYPGHEEGTKELHALLDWAAKLDDRRYDAMIKCYVNQPNDPPRMLAIRKKKTKKK